MATTRELLALEQAHRAAQAKLGVGSAYLALQEWSGVSMMNAGATSGSYLSKMLSMIVATRRVSLELGQAYYQYARALDTGGWMLGEWVRGEEVNSLEDVRRGFLSLLEEILALGSEQTDSDDPDLRMVYDNLRKPDDDNKRLQVFHDIDLQPFIDALEDSMETGDFDLRFENFKWPGDFTEEQLRDRILGRIKLEGFDEMERKFDRILKEGGGDLTSERMKQLLTESFDDSGSRVAGIVDWGVIGAGRNIVEFAQQRDRRVLMAARGVRPNCCAFCALLASRGFVYTKDTALNARTESGQIKKYHDNCHCFLILRWVNKTLPPANRFYEEKWYEVTKGLSGKDAQRAWRNWILRERDKALAEYERKNAA